MHRNLVIVGLVLLTQVGISQHTKKPTPMSDSTLDKVTASGITATATN